jgi:hypothetical protein
MRERGGGRVGGQGGREKQWMRSTRREGYSTKIVMI